MLEDKKLEAVSYEPVETLIDSRLPVRACKESSWRWETTCCTKSMAGVDRRPDALGA